MKNSNRSSSMPPLRPMLGHALAEFQQRYRATLRAANHPSNHVPSEVWMNDTYEVFVYRGEPANLIRKDGESTGFPELIWLSIKRYDRQPIHDWRDLQTIKNDVVGAEHDAFEMYPKESRLVDMANQYHLWVLADPNIYMPVGFVERKVSDKPEKLFEARVVQRKFRS